MPFNALDIRPCAVRRIDTRTRMLRLVAFVVAGTVLMTAAVAHPTRAHAQSTAVTKTVTPSKPHWRDLTAEQKLALAPLAGTWEGLQEREKRKWLVISRSQEKLSPAERDVQHSRMTEWAALSRQQREQARFNFEEIKQVPAAERKAKWEAYQALSEDEKRSLAERAIKRPAGVAGTIRPVPRQKLVPVPASRTDGSPGPRIELAPASSPTATGLSGPPPSPAPTGRAAEEVPSATPAQAPTPIPTLMN